MPAVSVLVPCFRSARFVRRALDSLVGQSFGDWEAVVVDNASDDETWNVARDYAARDPRFRVFRNDENVGPVRNWRRCAALARAEHAALLFSDDWYAPEMLAETLPFLADPGVGFAYAAVRIVSSPEGFAETPVSYALPGGSGVRSTAEFLRLGYRRALGSAVPVSPGCAVFRTADLVRFLALDLAESERYGFYQHGAGPDLAVYLQAALAYERFGHVATPRVAFLSHGGNLSTRPEVGRAYTVTLARFLGAAEQRAGPSPKTRAQLVARLSMYGDGDAARDLGARLGPLGRLLLAHERRLLARAVAARARG